MLVYNNSMLTCLDTLIWSLHAGMYTVILSLHACMYCNFKWVSMLKFWSFMHASGKQTKVGYKATFLVGWFYQLAFWRSCMTSTKSFVWNALTDNFWRSVPNAKKYHRCLFCDGECAPSVAFPSALDLMIQELAKMEGDNLCLVIRVFCFFDFVCVTGASIVPVISSCFSILVWNVYSCCMLLRNHLFCSFTYSACVILVFPKDIHIDFASDYCCCFLLFIYLFIIFRSDHCTCCW